ncbi:MAG: DEAD/DEAH box helicase [Planctomycetia bacterium]|nr:DEAD/DEAH box helicase [Planctomycetia bacterium]
MSTTPPQAPALTRDDLAEKYLAQLPFAPYPVQEDALLSWFTSEQGVLVCAPTGMGKTVIAEAALFEALHLGRTAYYTTPLIALTEQKFNEMQRLAIRWGFSADDVGLVTGNRRVNPQAKILVVVAEILLNRLLNPEFFDFSDVYAVVMDEFHNFADYERGIVWELSLALLPKSVRLLLLSATVGNAMEFVLWLSRCHGRQVQLVESKDRRVPLTYQWVEDELLNEQVEKMAAGSDDERTTPALIFCFNRDECWDVGEQLKGHSLLPPESRARLADEVNQLDLSRGAGSKLKQLLLRGVGVHHAGMLPRYRRIVEDLYQRKLLAVCVCTETLAAGINLPARSVVLTTLLKGPFGKKKMIEPSVAHQIFGRAGRPQFDTRGYVFVLAHEDDVKILRWKEKYDAIPENTKDPGLLAAKKALKKKRPTRRDTEQYWNEAQFEKLKTAQPGKLASRGPLPWRLLAYMLLHSPDVERIRDVVHKRLMDSAGIAAGEEMLIRMLTLMHHGGFVELDPPPPPPGQEEKPKTEAPSPTKGLLFGSSVVPRGETLAPPPKKEEAPAAPKYFPRLARPTGKTAVLVAFKSVNPLYGAFLLDHLGIANREERLQALESVLELPKPILKKVPVPYSDELPPGPLATTRLDAELIRRGLIVAPVAPAAGEEEEDEGGDDFDRPQNPALADKLRLLFDAEYPRVHDLTTQPVWVAGELLKYGGNFDKYIKAQDLAKQEGLIFRHLLRLVLLCSEFAAMTPADGDPAAWQADLRELVEAITASCRDVDPESTDKFIEERSAADPIRGEQLVPPAAEKSSAEPRQTEFGKGIFDEP